MQDEDEDFAALAPLTGLQRLELRSCPLPGPAVFFGLSSLQALSLDYCPQGQMGGVDEAEVADALDAALRALQYQLTELRLEPGQYPRPAAWPLALAACTRLRRLALIGETEQPALPPGEWLRGLRCLILPWEAAAVSLDSLQAAAPQLEVLGVSGTSAEADKPACQAVHVRTLGFAAAHPRLQRVVLEVGLSVSERSLNPPAEVSQAAAEARERKPGLSVVFTPGTNWTASIVLGGDAVLSKMHQVFPA